MNLADHLRQTPHVTTANLGDESCVNAVVAQGSHPQCVLR
jgi:hypothetical protein